MTLTDQVNESIEYITNKLGYTPTPQIGLVLGSGLGVYADDLTNATALDFHEIPYFKKSSVKGHKGKLIFGTVHGKDVVIMQGRYHYYEGNTMQEVTYPIRVLGKLGIQILFTTNATGGINLNFEPGDFMIITDHINFLPNPLIGPNDENFGTRFPDMSKIYDRELAGLALQCASNNSIRIHTGVMGSYSGPSFETPAEIRMYKLLGCDNVGMSTVPETIVARHMGIRVLSISAITNMAVGITNTPLNHEEVLEASNRMIPQFKLLVDEILKNIQI